MSLSDKARAEAEAAQLRQLYEYRQLEAEGFRFKLAKAMNNDILPMSMWSDWMEWRKKIKPIDQRYERFYK